MHDKVNSKGNIYLKNVLLEKAVKHQVLSPPINNEVVLVS